ncbi:MAG TPA: 4a-hydroxytetrahydrobiopterin dehydratase [Kofleriaceae bacterium]
MSTDELEQELRSVTAWRIKPGPGGGALQRSFEFADFIAAFGFMTRVALLAQAANHHPDWSNTYNKVTIRLSTHDAGGITAADFALARAIDGVS